MAQLGGKQKLCRIEGDCSKFSCASRCSSWTLTAASPPKFHSSTEIELSIRIPPFNFSNQHLVDGSIGEETRAFTMELAMFRRVFQDIPECRAALIRCLAGGNLIVLRKAIGFWLSDKEKRAYLGLLWDVFEQMIFEQMKWTEDAGRVTMMGQGLDFRRAEALIRDSALMRWPKVVPFIIMLRAPVKHVNQIPWITRTLSNIRRSTRMNVTEVGPRENKWDTKPIATIEGLLAGFDMSIPITTLTQGTHQDQLGTATVDRTAAMSIFQPALRNVNRIAIAKMELNNTGYETAAVVTYKTVDTFSLVISGPAFMTNVSLVLKSPSEGPRCDWPDNPQVFMRVVSNEHLGSDREREAIKKRNARLGW